MHLQYFTTLGVHVSSVNYDTTLNQILRYINKGKKAYICVAAVHLIMECQKDSELRVGVNHAALVTPDGMPLVWLLKLYGYKNVSRVYGPTLMEKLCALSVKNHWRIFLLGGAKGQGRKLFNSLDRKFPGLKIIGTFETPIRPISLYDNKQIIKQINKFKPHIVFVGLGCPWQEKWMIENRNALNTPALIGVGAAFDFLSGDKKQAPLWLQNIGLEWLFRFFQEPKRLWYRYTILNLQFLFLISKQLICDFLLK